MVPVLCCVGHGLLLAAGAGSLTPITGTAADHGLLVATGAVLLALVAALLFAGSVGRWPLSHARSSGRRPSGHDPNLAWATAPAPAAADGRPLSRQLVVA